MLLAWGAATGAAFGAGMAATEEMSAEATMVKIDEVRMIAVVGRELVWW